MDASVRHLGTDINYVVLENLYAKLKDTVEFRFNCHVDDVEAIEDVYKRQQVALFQFFVRMIERRKWQLLKCLY